MQSLFKNSKLLENGKTESYKHTKSFAKSKTSFFIRCKTCISI